MSAGEFGPGFEVGVDVGKFLGDEGVEGFAVFAVSAAGDLACGGAGDAMGGGFAIDSGAGGFGQRLVLHEGEEGLAEVEGVSGEFGFGSGEGLAEVNGGAFDVDDVVELLGGGDLEDGAGNAIGGVYPAVRGGFGDAVLLAKADEGGVG